MNADKKKSINIVYQVSVITLIITVLIFTGIKQYQHYLKPYNLTVFSNEIENEQKLIKTMKSNKVKIISYLGTYSDEYQEHKKHYVLTEYSKNLDRYNPSAKNYKVILRTDSFGELSEFLK